MSSAFPEEGEIVLATVTKIQYHSIFCVLDEYNQRTGMMHISEIAPGRIKNVTDYVKEGKSLVLKVLRVDPEKGHIDLSLRRVTEAQRRAKATRLKQEQIVKKILEQASEQLKLSPEDLRQAFAGSGYEDIYDAFQAFVESEFDLSSVDLPENATKVLESLIRDRIKPASVSVKGSFTIESYHPRGVELIQNAFAQLKDTEVRYLGGGKYGLELEASTYKIAEDELKNIKSTIKEVLGSDAQVDFERTDR